MNIFKQETRFLFSSNSQSFIPNPTGLPEIVFAGRSNVGKSSIINALTYRNNLARSSKTPGCTRSLNFFNVGNKLIIVDFPGYGYSKIPRDDWSGAIEKYLSNRRELSILFLLIDVRRSISPKDINVLEWLELNRIKYSIIITKCDKVSVKEIDLCTQSINYNSNPHRILNTSARKSEGMNPLRSYILSLL